MNDARGDRASWHELEKRTWELLQREHLEWLARGRTGAGRIDLARPDFLHADLHGLRFPGARFATPRFSGASLAASDLRGTEITDGEMPRVVLVYTGADGARWTNCDLSAASADLASFAAAKLSGCKLPGAALRRVSFAGAVLDHCVFDGAVLTDANFEGTHVTSSSFRDADLSRVDGGEFDPRGSARRAVFTDCDLRGANLDRLRLAETRFERCKLGGAMGRPTIRGEVSFVDCDEPPWA